MRLLAVLLASVAAWLTGPGASVTRIEKGARRAELPTAPVIEEAPLPQPVLVASFAPAGDRHPRDVPITIGFDGAVDRDEVRRSLRIEPPAALEVDFLDDRTLTARARHLDFGVMYRVTVAGASREGLPIDPFVGSFRTAIPAPARVVPGEGARVVLTFDDGTRTRTEGVRLLELLSRLDIRAILFPTGDWARHHPDLIARALADGHRVCNHTRSHRNLTTLGDAEVTSEILGGAGHGTCELLRPPSMGVSARVETVAAGLGYRTFLWDIDSRDWEGLPAEDLQNLVLGAVKPGAVVLMHMHGAHTLEALPALAGRLRAAGYVLAHDGPPSAEAAALATLSLSPLNRP